MNATLKFNTLITAILLSLITTLNAQFSGGIIVSDATLSSREWHITCKKQGKPILTESNGGVGVVYDYPLTVNNTFIIEDGPNDGDGWTADVRWFHIRSRYNGLYLTVQGTTAGSGVAWEEYHDSQGDGMWKQQFRLINTAETGWFKLRSRISQNSPDLVLSVNNDESITVEHPDLDPSPEQKFGFNLAMPRDDGTPYMILGIHNNDFITDAGFSNENRPAIHVEGLDYSCYWNFIYAGSGYYYLQNSLTGNYLSSNGSTAAGDPLYMNKNASENAKWLLERSGTSFNIKNKTSGFYISTKGQTLNGQPVYQSNNLGIGIKWVVLPMTAKDPEFLLGDYHHILDGASPLNDCIIYGQQFKKAIYQRVGLPYNFQHFNVIIDALTEYYGNAEMANQALQNYDFDNEGHRAELCVALRTYMLGTLAHKPQQNLTQAETDLLSYYENQVYLIRKNYADALVTAWNQFSQDFGINNGGDRLFSDLLDQLNADDFIWPGQYEPTSYKQAKMEEYSSACKTLNLTTHHQELGINIALIIEPLLLPGVAVALNMSLKTGVAALAPAIDYSLAPATVRAAQLAIRATVATASNVGTAVTIALVAAQLIVQEAMEAVKVSRLANRVVEKIIWGNSTVNIRAMMNSDYELGKVSLLNDLDYLMGAPLNNDFTENTNDNYAIVPFDLNCVNNVTVQMDANGTATLSPNAIAGYMVAQCGSQVSYNLSKSEFHCNDLGTQQVMLTAYNTQRTQSCTTNVTVQDNIAPAIFCKNAIAYLDAGGTAVAGYGAIYDHGSDNCGTVSLQNLSQNLFGCSHIGTNTVTLTANDGHGNTATCNATVTVTDNLPPTVVCKNSTVYLDANGLAGLTTDAVFQSGGDNCGVVNQQSVTPNSFTCSKLGTNSVVLLVNDGHGNTNNCTATVTVEDNIAPNVVCKNKTVYLDANGQANITIPDVFHSGTDNCGVVNTESALPNTFTCANLGTNTITVRANDSHGNTGTCNATVTVLDIINPTLLCKPATVYLDASGQATLSVSQIENGSFDNCSIASFTLNKTSFTCANLGTNNVELSGLDQSNNKGFCQTTVTVIDALPPVSLCKNLVLNLSSIGSASLSPNQVSNGSYDNCSFSMSVIPNYFTCSNVGNNTVTLRATDVSNNSSSCTAVVTVKDAIAPSALCKNPTIYLNNTGQATITVNDVDNGSNDVCGISTRSINNTLVNCSNLGAAVPTTLTVKDVNNNTSTCLSYVTVKDNSAPTAVCQNTTVHLGSNGFVTVYPANLADNSYDNCSVWSYSPTARSYTSANLGNNNLTITVKDWSNNAATCVSVVTVLPYNNNLMGDKGGMAPKMETEASIELKLQPNPASGESTLIYQLREEQTVTIQVFDMSGRLVYDREYLGIKGENVQPFGLDGFVPGVYAVSLRTGGKISQKRLIVQQ